MILGTSIHRGGDVLGRHQAGHPEDGTDGAERLLAQGRWIHAAWFLGLEMQKF